MRVKQELFELPVKKAMVKFVAPCILSQLVTMIHSLADTFFVGQTGDPNQVAGLALCFPIFMLTMAVGNLFGIGANSMVSRLLGMKTPQRAKNISAFAIWTSCCVIAVASAALAIFMRPILTAVGAKPETYGYARGYLIWVFVIGGIPTVFELVLANLLRAEGCARQASLALGAGGLLNTVLDPIFIFVFKLGAAGAGIATFIANAFSLACLIGIFVKNRGDTVLSLSPKNICASAAEIKEILFIGMPSFLSVILGSTANSTLNHYMTAYGTVNMAAYGIVQKIGNLTIQITVGVASGIMPLLGYHYAAKNGDRVRKICRTSTFLIAGYTVLCILLYELLAEFLVRLFISDGETVRIGAQFMRRWIFSAPGMCFVQLYNAIFQSMGKWKQSLFLSVMRQAGFLIPLLIILNKAIGMYGLVFAQPIADTITLVIGAVLYFKTAKPELMSMKGSSAPV